MIQGESTTPGFPARGVAVVTGAGSGIGAATAVRLASVGPGGAPHTVDRTP